MTIVIEDIRKTFDGPEVLKGVSAEIVNGEIFGIIGASGQGKSTLLRILHLLETPDSGRVLFGDTDLFGSEKPSYAVKRKMAMVFQKAAAFRMSVYDNVALGLTYRNLPKAEVRRRVDQALEEVGLTGYEDRQAQTLSGGELQRISLARAIVTKPEVLFMDEPTASLDPVNTRKIEKLVKYFNKEYGTTIILSTHDMTQGQRLANRLGVMMDGRFLQIGTPEEIFATPAHEDVARFIGIPNIFRGTVLSSDGVDSEIAVDGITLIAGVPLEVGEKVNACVRPEEISLHFDGRRPSEVRRNVFSGIIRSEQAYGTLNYLSVDCGIPLSALLTWEQRDRYSVRSGDEILLSFKPRSVHLMGGAKKDI